MAHFTFNAVYLADRTPWPTRLNPDASGGTADGFHLVPVADRPDAVLAILVRPWAVRPATSRRLPIAAVPISSSAVFAMVAFGVCSS
jgi:hypothetical protein